MSYALAFDRVYQRFGSKDTLVDLTFKLEQGKRLAVIGANGAGKSTLLRVITGLLKPYEGQAEVLGCPIDAAELLRGRLGYLGHQPMLYSELSARENLEFFGRLHRVARKRIELLLTEAYLQSIADEPIYVLSQGMQQRVAVCRALLHSPDLLVLDEPFANVDPRGREIVGALLDNANTTTVYTTHDLNGDLRADDHVLGLSEGQVQFCSRLNSLNDRELEELYR